MKSILTVITAGFFLWILTSLSWAESDSAPLGTVKEMWGKRVVKLKFADPSKVKEKDVFYIYRGKKVIGKVEVYDLGKETICATLLESTALPESGDIIKAEGEVTKAEPIDIDNYDKTVFPIFVKTYEYAFVFASAFKNFGSSTINMNEPSEVAKLARDLKTAGTEGWWRYMKQFQHAFTSPEMRKTFNDGSVFISESMTKLNSMKPPEAVESPHKRLISTLSQMQVVFTAFKNIPEGQDTYALNYMAKVSNRFFFGDMLPYTKNVFLQCGQTVNEYFQVFPEWKTRDSKGSLKKVI
ncbi:MAG: hypothetical protein AB9903_16505 [Vulcanimicrobiota bacterium]